MRKLAVWIALSLLASAPCVAQFLPQVTTPTAASFSGTYAWQAAEMNDYSIEFNMNGQQVGFCTGYVAGYGCSDSVTFNLLAGTIVADGAGHLTGTVTETQDPNSYKCSPKNSPTSPCPVVVPAGKAYSNTTAYKVGNTVDFTVGSTTRTFQAVKASTGKSPNWTASTASANICNNQNNPTCFWTQIPQSLTNNPTGMANTPFSGTYTVSSNGSGVMTFTIPACSNCGTVKLQFTVSPVSAVGQTIAINGLSQLGNSNNMVGTGVRIK